MDTAVFYDSMRAALWVSVIISTPILVVALVAGLTVGLFQALTSVQEMSLTFVPKLAAIGITFWMTMAFMTETLVSFFTGALMPIIRGG